MISILLADDHAVVRAGYRFLLSQFPRFRIVAESADSDGTYHKYFQYHPQVLILDLALPGSGGLSVLRRILGRDPKAKVLVVTMHEEALYAKRALEAGAKGYLPKSADPDLLPKAIEKVARGQTYVAEPIAQALLAQYASGHPEGMLARLSPREFEIFCLAARGLTLKQIATNLHISYKTAANYLTQIKHKLNVATLAELTHLAYVHKLFDTVI
ncbi:response regulator transcription factor [Methylothermus subterraneus]|nr:LuxR family DNA binding response regulator [uncultured Gammaproteobacteria bacterium]